VARSTAVVSCKLPVDQVDLLRAYAYKHGLFVSDVLRDALAEKVVGVVGLTPAPAR